MKKQELFSLEELMEQIIARYAVRAVMATVGTVLVLKLVDKIKAKRLANKHIREANQPAH